LFQESSAPHRRPPVSALNDVIRFADREAGAFFYKKSRKKGGAARTKNKKKI
jgi:hypothetical protein